MISKFSTPVYARLPRSARAFTLVELLVVIAIIGMLVGLLLPAVQQAREAARTIQCSNHIKNLATACQNVESTTGAFPSGGFGYLWSGDPTKGLGPAQPGSWMYAILPALEQDNMFQLPASGSNGMNKLLTTPLPVFYCPSRRTAKCYPTKNIDGHNFTLMTLNPCNKTDFAGNCGDATKYRDEKFDVGTNDNETIGKEPMVIHKKPSPSDCDKWLKMDSQKIASLSTGIFGFLSHVATGDIWDGAANTFLCGEKFVPVQLYEDCGISRGDDYSPFTGGDADCIRSTRTGEIKKGAFKVFADSAAVRPLQDRGGVSNDGIYLYGFGSPHAGVFGMAMCDSSVQRVNYSIAPEVYYCKGSRNDELTASSASLE